jgi:hypothetical protein
MPAPKLADRIRMNLKSQSPVQDTVDKLYDDITDAITRGSSYRAIHTQLTREGHNVGKGHSSLFAAYNVIKRRRDQQSAASPNTADTTERNVAIDTVAEGLAFNSAGQMPAAVIDTRRKTDEW